MGLQPCGRNVWDGLKWCIGAIWYETGDKVMWTYPVNQQFDVENPCADYVPNGIHHGFSTFFLCLCLRVIGEDRRITTRTNILIYHSTYSTSSSSSSRPIIDNIYRYMSRYTDNLYTIDVLQIFYRFFLQIQIYYRYTIERTVDILYFLQILYRYTINILQKVLQIYYRYNSNWTQISASRTPSACMASRVP